MTDIVETRCFGCMNLARYPRCLAYPAGIPDAIRQGDDQHGEPRGDEATDPEGRPYLFKGYGEGD